MATKDTLAPFSRPWRTDGSARNAREFTVMQWNVLAAGLDETGGFTRAPAACLPYRFRGDVLVDRILHPHPEVESPDVLCLQEVDRFLEHLEPCLRGAGYAGVFAPKAEGRDGCCVFWRKSRFALRWARPVRYRNQDGSLQPQLALLAALDDVHDPAAPLLVATTHLKAKTGFESLRGDQARQLRNAVLDARVALGVKSGVVIAGDFNDVPGSPAASTLLDTPLSLLSAYATRNEGTETPWTTWKVRADGPVKRTIDFMFYSPDRMRPRAILDVPPDAAVGDDGLPSFEFPSDHLNLLVSFERSMTGEYRSS